MREEGFSLIEVIVVIGIAGILMAIATLQFNEWTRKSNIEAQTKMMYADLMTVRGEALFRKKERIVRLTGNQFSVYSSNMAAGTPVLRKTLNYPIVGTGDITFDTQGLTNDLMSICVEPAGNPGAIDSIVVLRSRIQMGKRSAGDCSGGNIERK